MALEQSEDSTICCWKQTQQNFARCREHRKLRGTPRHILYYNTFSHVLLWSRMQTVKQLIDLKASGLQPDLAKTIYCWPIFLLFRNKHLFRSYHLICLADRKSNICNCRNKCIIARVMYGLEKWLTHSLKAYAIPNKMCIINFAKYNQIFEKLTKSGSWSSQSWRNKRMCPDDVPCRRGGV